MAVAIPIDLVRKVAGEIRDKGKVQRGWIGMSIGQNEDDRIEVVGIDAESPAELAKIKEGDVILAIDGKEIATTGDAGVGDPQAEARRGRRREDRAGRQAHGHQGQAGRIPGERRPARNGAQVPGALPPGRAEAFAAPRQGTAPVPPGELIAPRGREFSWERRKYIGVYLDELNKEMSAFFGVKDGTGLLVNRLTAGRPCGEGRPQGR